MSRNQENLVTSFEAIIEASPVAFDEVVHQIQDKSMNNQKVNHPATGERELLLQKEARKTDGKRKAQAVFQGL